MEVYPKISCVMVTAGRLDKIKRSTSCYLRQTYANRELVILSQGDAFVNKQIAEYIESLASDSIHLHVAPQQLTLGCMRNLSVHISQGDIICLWDDDDLYHPLRLAKQYNALIPDGVQASAYQQHLKWFEDTDEVYWVDWSIEQGEDRRYLHGTSMYRKKILYEYNSILYPESGPQSGREEDWNAVKKILKLGSIAGVQEGNHYIYTYHGNNIYDRSHHELVLRKRVYTTPELLSLQALIERSLKDCGVNRPVKVCSNQGVAFEFSPE